ncbi:gamma-glutamyltransferase [Rhizobium sp. S152]|uniref:gamma-glutamyltransferase n=1 Tax=Rhizobium sp. S152 TaxID=3055038 RepID=UPI0025A94D6B|nr:gamma-glutamyltransferase [Rhizobium sp. S152]MDM9627878.1 gamma-glutamyltransferase [Rhizobium sp. S152]
MHIATQSLPTPFASIKKPAIGSQGMVVTNHPLASAAGTEIMLAGGNAIDAAIASLFALTVVEPMMIGVLGGGIQHIRLSGGKHHIIDSLGTAPLTAHPNMYECLSDELDTMRETRGRENLLGVRAGAVPGSLAGWCDALARFGTMSLEDVVSPAIRYAERGFIVTPYLNSCIGDCVADLAGDSGLADLFIPNGSPMKAGERLVQREYAESLKLIARLGPAALYTGPLGDALTSFMRAEGGYISQKDLDTYRVIDRAPVRGSYRGYDVVGPPPPSSAGVHITQMLNILEGYDLRGMGFGSADCIHLLAEVLKIAFADRSMSTADPDFVDVPVERLISKDYAAERRAAIDMNSAQSWEAKVFANESVNTTHITVADAMGNVVSTTQTINGLFGACVRIPGTGMILNNYMYNFDPHEGRALSIAPGKRVFTSMAPMMVLKDDHMAFALGLPGALRIFPSAMQAIVNIIDHGMSIQDAVEAPRVWTNGGALELEPAFPDEIANELQSRGHRIARSARIAGGMNAIGFNPDGSLTGAACWRADGTPVAISGGLAAAGVTFNI